MKKPLCAHVVVHLDILIPVALPAGGMDIFVDPVKTRALITGVNVDTKYKEWTIDRAGTISVTIQDEGPKLSFYDRITFTEKFGFYSENYLVNEKSFVWLTFEPIEILGVYFYNIESTRTFTQHSL